ncbi:L-histidine N(alpha)-methyltransferase [Methylomonas sp. AM2-LC]|uniref:L-histidine N(alpha)-methyltransferase n=1 Tax=Methylomonas sp. AM2-LC TaxID=3153301 RepID=UPI0032662345
MLIKELVKQVAKTEDDFLAAVQFGLRCRQRAIPPKFFYDLRGSQLFEKICETPEYYPTRIETWIFKQYGAEMAEMLGLSCLLIELGSGSAIKTPLLLQHFADDAVYMPIDICEPHLLQSTQRLKFIFPAIQMHPLCADYMHIHSLGLDEFNQRRRVIFFPGSTIGNCLPSEAIQLLKQAAQLAGADGGLLIGVDCKKSSRLLNAAYNDANGYTAAFNLNLLLRIQNELGAELDVHGFAHLAYYNSSAGRIEMHLVSRRPQLIRLENETFEFSEGETIHTENSYKYTDQEFNKLAIQAGWQAKMCWADPDGLFNVHYFVGA